MASSTDGRLRISSGSPYEAVAGYCRALRVGNLVYVAGTATYQDGEVYSPGDAAAQTRRVLEIIEAALRDAGSGLTDVVRYRTFVTDIGDAEAVAAEMGRAFGSIRPVATLVAVSALVHPDLLVEIEVDAVIGDG
jgi:enamine deaminase RidA (YjgF/YER057c/UK114 family)